MKTNYSWFYIVIVSVLVAAMPAMAEDDDQKYFPSKNPWGETKVEPWAKTKVVLDTTGAEQAMTNAVAFSAIYTLTTRFEWLEKKCTTPAAKANPNDKDCSAEIIRLDEEVKKAKNSHWFTETQKKEIRAIANAAILGADKGDLAKIREAANNLGAFNERLVALETWKPLAEKDIKDLQSRVSTLENGKAVPVAPAPVAPAAPAAPAPVATERKDIVDSAQEGQQTKDIEDLKDGLKRVSKDASEATERAGKTNDRLLDVEKGTKKANKDAAEALALVKGKADVGIISAGLSGFVAKDLYVAGVTFEYTILKGRNRFGIGGGIGYYWDTESIHKDERIKARAPLFADASIRYTRQLKSVNWLELGGGVMSYFAGQPNSEHFGFGVFVSPQFNIPTPKKFEVGIGPRYGVTYGWSKRPLNEPPGLPAGARFQQYEHKGGFGWWNVSLDLTLRY